jgi:hypothetical protein
MLEEVLRSPAIRSTFNGSDSTEPPADLSSLLSLPMHFQQVGKPSASDLDGLTATQRRERDAKALQEKLAKKAQAEGK